GIGTKMQDDLRHIARERGLSLWAAGELLNTRAIQGFSALINALSEQAEGLELCEKVQLVVEKSGLMEFHKKDKDKGEEKVENLEELVNAAKLFYFDKNNEENMNELDSFLTHAVLESAEQQGDDADDCVQLMTLHTAKGLEFKQVFLVGMEEGLFPAQQSVDDTVRLEEERRLCYVGITRARQQLTITHAESRWLYGRTTYPNPSRFLRDIPVDLISNVRMQATVSYPITSAKPTPSSSEFSKPRNAYSPPSSPKPATRTSVVTGRYKTGQKVSHVKFGAGVVMRCEGEGDKESVVVNFKQVGEKKLMLALAKLDVL
ncbi:MAG: DNA helicase II / ATP-dependent DNA helicase PcrA, partial [Methylococcaceae bacterium NSP1-2]